MKTQASATGTPGAAKAKRPPAADTRARAASVPAARRVRDADATRARILEAAKKEFAKLGLGGARVDVIAMRAKANKRMIYHYFKDKDDLFRAVLEEVYADIRTMEAKLDLDALEPEAALHAFLAFTWTYYLKHPEFLALVNSANLHKGRHLLRSERFRELHIGFVPLLDRVLKRGAAQGVFREGIDPVHLNITIAAVGYYYLTNRYTGSLMYGRDLVDPKALEERLAFNMDSISRIVRL